MYMRIKQTKMQCLDFCSTCFFDNYLRSGSRQTFAYGFLYCPLTLGGKSAADRAVTISSKRCSSYQVFTYKEASIKKKKEKIESNHDKQRNRLLFQVRIFHFYFLPPHIYLAPYQAKKRSYSLNTSFPSVLSFFGIFGSSVECICSESHYYISCFLS